MRAGAVVTPAPLPRGADRLARDIRNRAWMAEALAAEDESQGVLPDRSPAHRARNATAYLQDRGLTRCINLRSADTGYVWNERGLTDVEWKALIAEPPVTRTIPVMRVLPPEAVVVLVS